MTFSLSIKVLSFQLSIGFVKMDKTALLMTGQSSRRRKGKSAEAANPPRLKARLHRAARCAIPMAVNRHGGFAALGIARQYQACILSRLYRP
jgi:hypothetical protein